MTHHVYFSSTSIIHSYEQYHVFQQATALGSVLELAGADTNDRVRARCSILAVLLLTSASTRNNTTRSV